MATLADGDLLLVQRGAASHKFTGKELLDQVQDLIPDSPTIDELDDIGDVNVSSATSGQVLTLVGSEWQAQDVSVDGALAFQGTVDSTSEDAPDSPENGWVFINTGSGTVGSTWTGIAGEAVSGGEQLLYDSGVHRSAGWVIVTSGGSVGVETVTANGGLKETGGDAANPVIAIDRSAVDAWYMGADSVTVAGGGGLKDTGSGGSVELAIDTDFTDALYVKKADLTNLNDASADLVVNSIKAGKYDISGLTALS